MAQITVGASLVLGGARSGKSTFAERLADESRLRKIYLATGERRDDEMAERIAQHRKRRGPEWQLVEEPLALPEKLTELAGPDSFVLVDCLTLWMTNLMMAEFDVTRECKRFVDVLTGLSGDSAVVLVSNEVGLGIVPMEKMAREFRDYAGKLHQDIAAVVPNVWFVTAGLPQRLK